MFGFSVSDIVKWSAILAIAGIVAGGGLYLVKMIENNAIAQTQIEALQTTIDEKDKQIKLYGALLKASTEVNAKNAKQIEELDQRFESIEQNLGPDQEDAAHPSTKELFRRLNSE